MEYDSAKYWWYVEPISCQYFLFIAGEITARTRQIILHEYTLQQFNPYVNFTKGNDKIP